MKTSAYRLSVLAILALVLTSVFFLRSNDTVSDDYGAAPTGQNTAFAKERASPDCGVLCLSAALRLVHGDGPSAAELKEGIAYGREGASLEELATSASQYGLFAKGYQCSFSFLISSECDAAILLVDQPLHQVPDPHYVLAIDFDESNHRTLILDPPERIMWQDEAALGSIWKGYALLLKKGHQQ